MGIAIPPDCRDVPANWLGSGNELARTVESASIVPNSETIAPGAMEVLGEKVAPLTTPPCGTCGGLMGVPSPPVISTEPLMLALGFSALTVTTTGEEG